MAVKCKRSACRPELIDAIMRFSERMGFKSASAIIQVDSMTEELRNGLWSQFYLHLSLNSGGYLAATEDISYEFFSLLHFEFFKRPIDEIARDSVVNERRLRDWFFNADWYEVYDFIDYVARLDHSIIDGSRFVSDVNGLLEREYSAYRIIQRRLAPISNDIDISTIDDAFDLGMRYSALSGVNIHLHKALEFLSNRNNSDYRNSIRESISAVEVVCRQLTQTSTFGAAMKKLRNGMLAMDPQLISGFEKIYAYTNQPSGIRHGIISLEKSPDYHDAKYMLVACSALVNYLIGKDGMTQTHEDT